MLEHLQYGGRFPSSEIVGTESCAGVRRWMVDGADNPLHDVVDVREIALQRAARIELDRLAGEHRVREFENGHIGAAPWTIDGKQPEGRHGQTILVGVAK